MNFFPPRSWRTGYSKARPLWHEGRVVVNRSGYEIRPLTESRPAAQRGSRETGAREAAGRIPNYRVPPPPAGPAIEAKSLQGAATRQRPQRASGGSHRGPRAQFPGLHQIPAAARRPHRHRVPFVAALHPRPDADPRRPDVCVGREDADGHAGLIHAAGAGPI